MQMGLPDFSDYIVFVDESGSPSMNSIDPNHPVFVLVFCIFNKWEYCDVIQPAIKRLKFEFFGHDMTILHSHEIRKRTGEFDLLMIEEHRLKFLSRLDNIVRTSNFDIIATIIDKRDISDYLNSAPDFIYHDALWECTKKLHHFLESKNALHQLTHIIAESRGRVEDRNLAKVFDALCYAAPSKENDGELKRYAEHFALLFAEKKINSAGLQLADLVGHPIGRHAILPLQSNHAFDGIKNKIIGEIQPAFIP